MLQQGTALLRAACAQPACSQQLPGTVKLLEVLSGTLRHHLRNIAQAARQMEPADSPTLIISTQQQHQHDPLTTSSSKGVQASPDSPSMAEAPHKPALQPMQQQQVVVPAVVQPHQPPSPTGVKKTFYKRKLPCPPATEFSSADGEWIRSATLCW